MLRILFTLAAALLFAGPLHAQGVTARDTKLGNSRTTEVTQTPTGQGQTPQNGKPAVGATKAGKVQPAIPKDVVPPALPPLAGQGLDPKKGDAQVRDALNESLNDLAKAMRSLNPSFVVPSLSSSSASIGCSGYSRNGAAPKTDPAPK